MSPVPRIATALLWLVVIATTADANPLEGTRWQLVSFQSMDDDIGVVRPDDPSLYTLELYPDGTAALRLDCNRGRGTWEAVPTGDGDSGQFSFGPLKLTRAACPPPSLSDQIANHAAYIRSFLLQEGRLYLSLLADGGIYAWESTLEPPEETDAVPAAPEDGGPRNWRVTGVDTALNLRALPTTEADIVARLAPGTLLDNFGCQQAEERIWCDVQPLGGGPAGYVAAAYLAPAAAPDGSIATGPDDSALRAGKGDFDATGTLPCAAHRGQPLGRCTFGVARAGGGYATVVVDKPDGGSRAISFRLGRPIGADISEADDPGPFSATQEDDLQLIRIGDERYEIPDAVIFGG